jgi:hypothetical protein
MTMAIHIDNALGIATYYDPEAPAPTGFLIWFENLKVCVVAAAGETPAATWQRVLAEVKHQRNRFLEGSQKDSEWKRQGYFRGNPHQHAHVIAGIEMPEEIRLQLFKHWGIWWFDMMGTENRNPDHDARVAALTMACKLAGMDTPQRAKVRITVCTLTSPQVRRVKSAGNRLDENHAATAVTG